MMQPTSARAVVEQYPSVFFDAYGVLVDGAGAIAGAAAFLTDLRASGQPFYVLTNDASRLPTTSARRYRDLGLPIDEAQILTSGSQLKPWFARENLAQAQCLVIGPQDTEHYVERAGGRVLDRTRARPEDVDVIVVGDESGFPFVETVDLAVTAAIVRLDQGRPAALVCPNPDLIFPKSLGAFGIGAGSIAGIIENALAVRFIGMRTPQFTYLGKPHPPMFEAGCALAETREVVMFGDQISTDIRGANRAGLASALVSWGLTGTPSGDWAPHDRPTFFVNRWQ